MSKLTIAIPTIQGREEQFDKLVEFICNIAPEWVELIYCKDNKEISIGAKRQVLLEAANGEYIMMLDDDDLIPDYYFDEIGKALESNPDCVGYLEQVGNKIARHSNHVKEWTTTATGYDRTIFYKDVIRTELARKAGFRDLRYGEDADFANRLKPLLNTEVFINKIMYIYNEPKAMNRNEHNKRYGIK